MSSLPALISTCFTIIGGIESNRNVPAGGRQGAEVRYYHSIGEGVAVRPGQRAGSESIKQSRTLLSSTLWVHSTQVQ